jgi:hypothetical protein
VFINYRSQPVSKLTKSRPGAPRRLAAFGRSPGQRLTSSDKGRTKSIQVTVPEAFEGKTVLIVKIGKGA